MDLFNIRIVSMDIETRRSIASWFTHVVLPLFLLLDFVMSGCAPLKLEAGWKWEKKPSPAQTASTNQILPEIGSDDRTKDRSITLL